MGRFSVPLRHNNHFTPKACLRMACSAKSALIYSVTLLEVRRYTNSQGQDCCDLGVQETSRFRTAMGGDFPSHSDGERYIQPYLPGMELH